ncbi:MAG: hypothetical protein Q4C59_10345, partial [Lachnospiraceae bacterium]|nr:hypothetical protein [Lachnospiraceae bacterium]
MNEVGNWWKDVTYEETVKIIESNIKTGEKAIDSLKENCTTLRRAYVAIGWYLRNARNRELFLEGGYRNVWEFAKDKFGYTRDEATRLIGINTKFSKGGNSPVLDDKYKEFGKSQLQEMLSLPDAKLEEVTPDMSVRQIRALKKPEPIIEEPESQQPEVAESKEVYKDTEKKEIMVQAFTYPALKEIIPALNQKIYELHENNFTAVIEVIVPVLPIRQDGLSVKDVGGIRIDLGDKYAVWPYYSFMKMYMESGLYERPGQETDLAGTAKECATPHKEPEFSPAELEEQVLDERYNIGDLPQAKDKYLYRLAKVLVSERGLRLFTFSRRYISDKTIKDEIQMLGWKKDNSIEIGEGVIAYTCADSIEFSKGNEDLGMCSYARFANQVRKVMENWNPEAAKKEEQTSTEEVCATSHAEEEQLPGQMNVQDYPETMPEVVKDEAWFVREYFDRYGSSYLPELMRICRENKSNSDRAKAA